MPPRKEQMNADEGSIAQTKFKSESMARVVSWLPKPMRTKDSGAICSGELVIFV